MYVSYLIDESGICAQQVNSPHIYRSKCIQKQKNVHENIKMYENKKTDLL